MRSYEQQQMIPGSKAMLRPGVFSNYSQASKLNQGELFLNNSYQNSKTNTTQDTTTNKNLTLSADINHQTFQLIQQHLQQKQRTPSRPPPQVAKYQSDDNMQRSNSIKGYAKSLVDKNKQHHDVQPNEFLQALLEQNINKTKRPHRQGEVKGLPIANIQQMLNDTQDQSPNLRQKRKENISNRKHKCPSQHQQPRTRNESHDKIPKHVSVDIQKPHKTLDNVQQVVRSGKKLSFNLQTPSKNTDQDFLNTTNQMANMIIENILNKEDHTEKLKKENQDLKEIQFTLQKQNQDLRKSLLNSESFSQEIKLTLDAERSKYHKELVRFQEKLGIVKQLQSSLQGEKLKNETYLQKVKEQVSQVTNLKDIISSIALSSMEFLGNFQQQSQQLERQQQYEAILPAILNLLQNGLRLVFEIIQNTQQIKLAALKDFHIPENFDFESFFRLVEVLKNKNNDPPLSDTIPDDSQCDSQEISFRQKHPSINQIQISLPISQVQNKLSVGPSRDFSIQDQFNTFLEIQDDVEELPLQIQIGSPYFNQATLPLFVGEKETASSKDMPLQMQSKKSVKQNQNSQKQQSNHFHTDSINESDRDPHIQKPLVKSSLNKNTKHLSVVQYQQDYDQDTYDSLFLEMSKNEPKQKKNSIHNMNYLDQQADRGGQKYEKKKSSKNIVYSVTQGDQPKKIAQNKENLQQNLVMSDPIVRVAHCVDTWAVAKSSYNALKENDLSFLMGDKIQILKKTQNGNWIGMFEKQIGYFPHNLVVLLE